MVRYTFFTERVMDNSYSSKSIPFSCVHFVRFASQRIVQGCVSLKESQLAFSNLVKSRGREIHTLELSDGLEIRRYCGDACQISKTSDNS